MIACENSSSAVDAGAEVGQIGGQQVERRDLGAGAAGEDLEQPQVVHVLVGDDDQLEVLDRVAERRKCLLELVERLAGVGPVSISVSGSSSIR